MDQEKQRLLKTIQELYWRVVWTHKTHEKQREIYSSQASRDKLINAALTGSTTVILIIGYVADRNLAILPGTILAFISTMFATYRLSFSPENEALAQRQAAKSFLEVRDYLFLLFEPTMAPDANLDKIREQLRDILTSYHKICQTAPDTTSKAYNLAEKALSPDGEMNLTERELSRILPPEFMLKPELPPSSNHTNSLLP